MRWIAIILTIFVCYSSPVQAQDPLEEPSDVRYTLPEIKTNAAGQKCLGFEEWKKVLIVASEYKKNFEWRLSVKHVLLEYAALDGIYTLQEEDMSRVIDRLEYDREHLELRLVTKEEERLKQLKGYRIERGLMWGVILVETAVIGFLGVRSALSP